MPNTPKKSLRSLGASKQKSKLLFLGILFFAIFGLAKNASAGTAFYVNPTASGGGNGTYASPWNSLSQVNEHSFSTGDDVYFKANTTLNVPAGEYLDIIWAGTSGDWVHIGAYYGENQFGLGGNARPILDFNYYDLGYGGAIQRFGSGYPTRTSVYVEVENIRIDRPFSYAIEAMDVDYLKITNCYIYHGYVAGAITVTRSQEVVINGNTIDHAAYGGDSPGSCLQVGQEGQNNTTVSNNIISGSCTEGIGAYHKGENYEIFGNIVFDTKNIGIYVDRAKYVNIYDNIVYSSTTRPGGGKIWMGIAINNELQFDFCYTGYVNIHDNMVANTQFGIAIDSENTSCINQYDNIYGNRIADCDYNFGFYGGDFLEHDNNVYNNISYTSNNSTMVHSNNYSFTGITWGANIFDDAVTGNAGDEDCTVALPLEKTTGWDSLNAREVTVSDFDLSSAGLAGRTACFGGDTTAPGAPSGLAVE